MKNEMSTKFPVTIARKKILAVVLCGIMALSLGACGSKDNGGSAKTDDGSAKKEASGGETYNWQIGNVLSADQPWDLGLNKFAELLPEYSDGRITATVQSGGTLGSEIEMLEAVQMGTLDMSIASTPSLSGFTDCMNYFDLPYLFKATDSAWSVMDEWLGQDRCEALEGSGFKGLGFYDNGEYMIGSNKKLVHPEDAKGIRMRMLESSVCVDSLGELGIDAVSMSFGELFTALQTRVLSFPQVSVSSSTV